MYCRGERVGRGAHSCKGRGVCPSCDAQRMLDIAAHFTEHVMPTGRLLNVRKQPILGTGPRMALVVDKRPLCRDQDKAPFTDGDAVVRMSTDMCPRADIQSSTEELQTSTTTGPAHGHPSMN